MNELQIVNSEEDHFLKFVEGSQSVPLPRTCQKCIQPVSKDYYECTTEGCNEYYIHKECVELKDLPHFQHPLHPQHTLVAHYNYPCEKSFVCSFCGETKQSRQFCQCSDDQCDFYLDSTCESDFIKRPELLDKYEIQHVLHHHENHRLSPYTTCSESDDEGNVLICAGCTILIPKKAAAYKCISCDFYLHIECSQVPKEVVQYQYHPQHPLVLLQKPPPPASHHDHSDDDHVRCTGCLKWIEGGFYLHCNHCPTFNLDLNCYFRSKPTLKHEAHEHPLAYVWKIYEDDVRCYACNTPCDDFFFRCFTCNFNIHCGCNALPITVNYYDHVHPLTLTTSFKQDGDPTTYYCDICEKRRDPDRGIYLCKECPFMAHFECALSLSTTEEIIHKYAAWHQKIEEDNHRSDEEEDMTLTNEKVFLEIIDQLNVEIEKLGEVIQQLIIKKREGEQLTEKIQEFNERSGNAEDMISRLKQSVRRIEYN